MNTSDKSYLAIWFSLIISNMFASHGMMMHAVGWLILAGVILISEYFVKRT